MSSREPLQIDGDPASCSQLGGALSSASARLSDLDAFGGLAADLGELGTALQRYAARLVDLAAEAAAVERALEEAGLMVRGRTVVPGWGVRDPDAPQAVEALIPQHDRAVRQVVRHTSRARRRLQVAAQSLLD